MRLLNKEMLNKVNFQIIMSVIDISPSVKAVLGLPGVWLMEGLSNEKTYFISISEV
jgi:hypothetical protein